MTLVTSELARLELHAALQRKEAAGDLLPGGARRALAAYDADVTSGLIVVKAMDSVVVRRFGAIVEHCYRHVPPILFRTLDAIHVSTAAVATESIVVATDKRLREAALSLGFAVFPSP